MLPDEGTDLFGTTFPLLCQTKVFLSGNAPIGSRLWQVISLAEEINHLFKLYSCIVEESKVLRILYVGRRTRCIKDLCTKVSGLLLRLFVFIIQMFVGFIGGLKVNLIGLNQVGRVKSLPEKNKKRGCERTFMLKLLLQGSIEDMDFPRFPLPVLDHSDPFASE